MATIRRAVDAYTPKFFKVRNVNITTDLNTTTPVEVPFAGGSVITGSDTTLFTLVGNGIRCNFNGRVLLTMCAYIVSDSQNCSAVCYIAKNGVAAGPERFASGYMRNTAGANEAAMNACDYLDVVTNDVLSVYSSRDGGAGTAVLNGVGTSFLLVTKALPNI